MGWKKQFLIHVTQRNIFWLCSGKFFSQIKSLQVLLRWLMKEGYGTRWISRCTVEKRNQESLVRTVILLQSCSFSPGQKIELLHYIRSYTVNYVTGWVDYIVNVNELVCLHVSMCACALMHMKIGLCSQVCQCNACVFIFMYTYMVVFSASYVVCM